MLREERPRKRLGVSNLACYAQSTSTVIPGREAAWIWNQKSSIVTVSVINVSVDVKQHLKKKAEEFSELMSCVKDEVPVSLIVLIYGLCGRKVGLKWPNRDQGLCESRGGCPGLPVPNGPDGLCGRKATLNLN